MIITILPNSSNFHAVAYNEKKVSQGLAELIEVRVSCSHFLQGR